jgi:hypothetical protein
VRSRPAWAIERDWYKINKQKIPTKENIKKPTKQTTTKKGK